MTMARSIRRKTHSSAGLTTGLAATFVVMLIGAQSCLLVVPVNSSSILNHIMDQGNKVVGAITGTASLAYDDLSSVSMQGVREIIADVTRPMMRRLSRDDSNSNSDSDNCTNSSGFRDALCAPKDPDAKRNVSEIIRSRGFEAQEYDVHTEDGYILTIQRIINPLVDASQRGKLKPVILQHGLMSSSVDWVINSVDVRPSKFPRRAESAAESSSADGQATTTGANQVGDSQEEPNSLGFYLANEGYDVFLANSRGNVYGQRHESLSTWQPAFWSFTFDEQIKYDLPAVIEFVQKLTGHNKLGYVGHSQGTTMALGLLADRPDYADIMEPVVLLAPVAYVNHCKSPAKYFSIYTPIFAHINMWFASSNVAVRYLAPIVCGPTVVRRDICENLVFLGTGFDESQFNDTRVSAYLSHMPSGTSVKNIAHWGQEVLSGRFAHFDHGILGNQARYGVARPPDYDIGKIRSKSIALFVADNDWLASPVDVARLRAELREPPVRVVNVSEYLPAWNHIDFLYGKDCGRLVNKHAVEVFHQFDG